MILIINVCKEKLHYYEFVKPIEDILKRNRTEYITKHYNEIQKADLEKCNKIIICGTSLKDNMFLNSNFNWLKEIDKPMLGICAGMQLIGLVFGGKLQKATEIGYYEETFNDFLGISGKQEVYHLHNNYVEFSYEFDVHTDGKIIQAVKHKTRLIYGVLFHPEVRNKQLVLNFANIKN